MKAKFLLLLGVTGCGKTTLIRRLEELDPRFVYVRPYTTRFLRDGEFDKVHISEVKMLELWKKGELVALTELYGVKYGTPLVAIDDSLNEGSFPVLDFPIQKLHVLEDRYADRLLKVYVRPPSLEELRDRLKDREDFTARFAFARDELALVNDHELGSRIDLSVVNHEIESSAAVIYEFYLSRIEQ